MHITLILLAAAGQVVTAFDPQITHLPRAANQDDNLATITALSDGHLPTCFTGHPTYPCPTNGPQAKRALVGGMEDGPFGGPEGSPFDDSKANPLDGSEGSPFGGSEDSPLGGSEASPFGASEDNPFDNSEGDFDDESNPVETLAGNPMGDLPAHVNEVARIVPIEQIDVTASGMPALPTGAPKVGPRDAAPEVWSKDDVPEPHDWAIPGKFKFTDSIDHNSTGHKYTGHHGHNSMAHYSVAHNSTAHNSTGQHGHKSNAHYSTARYSNAHKYASHEYTGYNSTAHESAASYPAAHESAASYPAAHNSTASYSTAHNSTAHHDQDPSAHYSTARYSNSHKYISHNFTGYSYSNGTTASAVALNTSSIEEYHVAPTAVTPQKNNHVDHYNNHYVHQHNSVHHNKQPDTYVHTSAISESVTAPAYSKTTDAPILPITSHKQQANSTSEAQVAGSIGTLLSAAMYPGSMRKPNAHSTTQVQQASISTSCTASSSTASMYDVKPVTMVTSSRPVALSEAQPTASYMQHTARHFVS
jgi:hypothetical protein